MKHEDFRNYGITDFAPVEITRTGARLADIKIPLMVCAQSLREDLGRRVKPICFTTGRHAPKSYHRLGRAMDFILNLKDGPIDISEVFKGALNSCFNGIGIYWNGTMWSFHVDTRPRFGFWSAVKRKGQRSWRYYPLSLNPGWYRLKAATL